MIKTNTKLAKQRIRKAIINNYNDCLVGNYDGAENTENWEVVKAFVCNCFYNEMVKHDNRYKALRVSKYELFIDWCSGLCSALPTDYYYNESAVDIAGEWLEQTETEKSKYTEDQAAALITRLFYRELGL